MVLLYEDSTDLTIIIPKTKTTIVTIKNTCAKDSNPVFLFFHKITLSITLNLAECAR